MDRGYKFFMSGHNGTLFIFILITGIFFYKF